MTTRSNQSNTSQASSEFDDISKRLASESGERFWRSLDELARGEAVQDFVQQNFPSQRERLFDKVDRRSFLHLMGASMALAGLGSCTRQPEEKILPYARTPESTIPGEPVFFATTMADGGDVQGLLVESHTGRPTKIEGNPQHPGSLGATNAIA